jgi:hypothetical protein
MDCGPGVKPLDLILGGLFGQRLEAARRSRSNTRFRRDGGRCQSIEEIHAHGTISR